MRDYIYNHRKGLITTLISIAVAIVLVSVYFIVVNKINSATIDIRVVPQNAKILINDKEYKSIQSYSIRPGDYTIEVSAEGFFTETSSFSVAEGETYKIDMFLEPTDDNLNWYSEHRDDALILGEIKNALSSKAVQKLQSENPILSELPMNIDYYTNNNSARVKYTISYKLEENNTKIILVITDYTGGNYNDAISRLEKRGVGKDQYVIRYVDKTSDLEWGRAAD